LESLPIRFGSQHLIDAEMLTDVSQELDVLQFQQPVGIVHEGRGRVLTELASLEVEIFGELGTDPFQVTLEIFDLDDFARTGAASRISDHCRTATGQRYGPMAESLERAMKHKRGHMAGVEADSSGIVADVVGAHTGCQVFAQAVF